MINQPDMDMGPEGEDVIVNANPDSKELEVYCGECNDRMVKMDNKRYRCPKCGLERTG